MRLGVHIRIAGGLIKALDRAVDLGCETVQLFSGNPNSWVRKPLDLVAADLFASKAAELDIRPIILHTPYLVNLASPDDATWEHSRVALADAVSRAPYLGATLIVTHIGSHKGAGYDLGVSRIAESVRFALEADPRPMIALELGAGAGNTIGSRFEHLADILERLPNAADRVSICIDTAHLYGSGYDISTAEGVHAMFAELDRHVGLDKLRVVHLNDTLKDLGSHHDRHHHIGKGNIGEEGFRAIINYPRLEDLPGIIETPGETIELDRENLRVLRGLRSCSIAGESAECVQADAVGSPPKD
ncbi:MAG: deoxyribonuclease IV [Armatimonadetes bacterium]|nr:deoxyribonuclease IV [Armatimonadota bacterium]